MDSLNSVSSEKSWSLAQERVQTAQKIISHLTQSDQKLQGAAERAFFAQGNFVTFLEQNQWISIADNYPQIFSLVGISFEGFSVMRRVAYLWAQQIILDNFEKNLHQAIQNHEISGEEKIRVQAWIKLQKEHVSNSWSDLGVKSSCSLVRRVFFAFPIFFKVSSHLAHALSALSFGLLTGIAMYELYLANKKLSQQKEWMQHLQGKSLSDVLEIRKEQVDNILAKRKNSLEQQKNRRREIYEKELPDRLRSLPQEPAPAAWQEWLKASEKLGFYFENALGITSPSPEEILKGLQDVKIADRLFNLYADREETKAVLAKNALKTLVHQKHRSERTLMKFTRGRAGVNLGILTAGTSTFIVLKILAVLGLITAATLPFVGMVMFSATTILLLIGLCYIAYKKPHTMLYQLKGGDAKSFFIRCMIFIKEKQLIGSLNKSHRGPKDLAHQESLLKDLEKWQKKLAREVEKKSRASWKDFLRENPCYRSFSRSADANKATVHEPFFEDLKEALKDQSTETQKEAGNFFKDEFTELLSQKSEEFEQIIKRYCAMDSDQLMSRMRAHQEIEALRPSM